MFSHSPGGNRARSLRIEPLEDRALLTVVSGEVLESGEMAIGIADSPSTPPDEFLDSMTVAAEASASAVILTEVPTSYWTYGCGATAVGMLFGYYDRVGYDNMYTGPTNGGVAPLVDLGQGSDPADPIEGSCSLIATMNGFDGRTTAGHVDDYWIASGSGGPDPWEATGVEHVREGCVADFIGTNQWKWDTDKDGTINANSDGVTRFYYWTSGAKSYDPIPTEAIGEPRAALCHGMRLFAESRGYFVAENYNQLTDNQSSNGFTFQEYMAEIDAGYPVIVHTNGHIMTGVGYDEATRTVYLHNTWGNTLASMTWGGSYSGSAMRMVTVIHLESPDPQYDWGDAPDPDYPTLASSGGAWHQILPTGPFLGATADAEADGLASDDLDGSDDEDGVRFTTDLVAGGTAGVNLLASGDGLVSAWVDFNDDGDWDDPGEEILTDVPVTQGATAYTFQVPRDAVATEETYARFRISTAGGLGPGGGADDGEVEDYAVSVSSQLGAIEGVNWLDEDSDGVHDPEEPGLAGVQMYLDANDNGVWDEGEQTTTTGTDGSYRFTGVAPGVQIVREVAAAGMTVTSPGIDPGIYVGTAYISGTNTVEVTTIDPVTGQVTRSGVTLNVKLYAMVTTNDGRIFGISSYTDSFYEVDPTTMQLELVGATGYELHQGLAYDPQTDTIYGVGTDGNSSRKYLLVFDRETGLPIPLDDGSSIVSGVGCAAWDATNQRILVFYNASDQFFAYDTAGRATYLSTSSVAIEGRSLAWNGTSAVMQAFNANGNLSLLFFDPETGAENASRLTLSESTPMESLHYVAGTSYGYRVYVEAGETESGLDFGTDAELGEIRGTKWHDLDEDGEQDSGEPGLEGWTVFLDMNANGLLDDGELAAVTDSNGKYVFSDLPVGMEYSVVEVPQSGWYQTSPDLDVAAAAGAIAMNANDLVFDPWRNILYGTTTGEVLRYDLASGTMLPPLAVGNQELLGVDITPDGEYLYVAGGVDSLFQIARIQLDTGTVTAIDYVPESLEGGPCDIAVSSEGYAILTTRFGGSGWNPLRHISLADDSVTIVDAEPGSSGAVRQDTRIVRSEDYDVFYFAEANISSGPTFTFDAFSGDYAGPNNMGAFVGGLPIAIDRDGELVAINTFAAQIYDASLALVQANVGVSTWDGGLAFDPVRDWFYFIDEDSDAIRVYDTNTWSELFQRTGFSDSDIGVYENWNTGVFAFSEDGRFMFVTDEDHVDVFRMFTSRSVTVAAGTTSGLDFGSQRNDFYAMEADPPAESFMVRHSFSISVRLNEDVDPASVDPADATMGGIAATSVAVDRNQVTFSFTDVPNGAYDFAIADSALASLAGEPVASFSHPINVLADDDVGFASGTLLVVNYPSATTEQISEYTLDGSLVQEIAVSHGGDDFVRDLVVGEDHCIEAYAGTTSPVLVTMQVAEGTSSDHSLDGWSTASTLSTGGIASLGDFVFVTDMQTASPGEADGIIRFDTTDFSAVRFGAGDDYVDLTIGHDGLLYGLEGSTIVHVFDPYSLAELRTVTLSVVPMHRALAVDQHGDLFCAAWNGTIYHYDPSGLLVDSLATGVSNLGDIDLRADGMIAVTSWLGPILVTDTSLDALLASFSVPAEDYNMPFVAFSDPVEFPTSDLIVTIVEPDVEENGGSTLVTITRTTDPTSDLVVTLSAGADGMSTVPATITIPAGHEAATFTLEAVDNAYYGGDATITLVASAAGHNDGSDTVVVLDDETQPTVSLSVSQAELEEDGGTALLTVTLSGLCNMPVTVQLGFDGTATLGEDYTAVSSLLEIPAMSLSGSVTLTALADTASEGDETIVVNIVSVTNALELGEQQATTTILDDPGAVYLTGGSSSDTIRVTFGMIGGAFHEVNIGGTVTTYDPALVREFYLDGAGGSDRITIIGSGEDESVVLMPNSADVIGQSYEFHATNVESITIDGGEGSDEVELIGSDGSNRLFSYADSTRLSDIPRTFSYQVDGFETVTVDSSAGSNDYAFLYDSPENDVLTALPDEVELGREDGTTTRTATGFEKVYAYATAGGSDRATLTGADGARNRLYSFADYTTLTESGRSFYFYARGFDSVSADSPGSGASYAYLYDSVGDDALEASPDSATMDRAASSDVTATGFLRVYAYATRGGDDSAVLTGSAAGGNRYRGYPTYSTLTDATSSFYHYARGFDSVAATGSQSDSSGDRAWLYDSSGDDTLAAAVLENGKYQGASLSDNGGNLREPGSLFRSRLCPIIRPQYQRCD